VLIDQFTRAHTDRFYAGHSVRGGRALAWPSCARCFCVAVHRQGISETPVSPDIKPPVGSSKSADKMPFSEEELDRIKTACDNANRPMRQRDRTPGHVGCEYKNAQGSGAWTGEDIKDLIELMLHTGFRISDATLFVMSQLQGNNVMIRSWRQRNLIFAGPIGTGKTHLAIALGVEATKQRRRVLFTRAAALVRQLIEARGARELTRRQQRLLRCRRAHHRHELGFVPFDPSAASCSSISSPIGTTAGRPSSRRISRLRNGSRSSLATRN
jgi:integrase